MSYYLFSAELPSALLRGKFIIHFSTLPLQSPSSFSSLHHTVKTGPVTFFTNSIMGIATWCVHAPFLSERLS
jgi:hypothetical protein